MRFVLQTVKAAAQPAEEAKRTTPPTTSTAPTQQQQTAKQSNPTTNQPPAPATSATVTRQPDVAAVTQPAPIHLRTAVPAAAESESQEAVEEVRLRFDTTYSAAVDSSRREREDDEFEYDGEEGQEDEYSEVEEDEEDEEDVGAPSVAINCSYSINPTSALQRSMHHSQMDGDDEQAIEEEEEEEEAGDEHDGEHEYQNEEKQQYDEDEEANEDDEQPETTHTDGEDEETELHHFVALDASVTHILHSQTLRVDSSNNISDDEDDAADELALQLHAFQPHAFHIQPQPYYEQKGRDEEGHDEAEEATEEGAGTEEAEDETHEDEQDDGVSELCTVQIHQHSLLTQHGQSQSHWHAVDTPSRTRHNQDYAHSTPTPTSTLLTQTASFTLNDSSDDIKLPQSTYNTPSKRSQLGQPAGEWDEATHEARVQALQVELKERVEARRRKLRRASYVEEMEERRLQKELEAKQRALQQLRLLRVKQQAQEQLAALALQKQQEADERERKQRKDKENVNQAQLKRRSTDNSKPTHTHTPSSLVMRKRIKQAHYDRLLKAVERGDTFTKYYDSWYCKPKPKFVRVVCLTSPTPSTAAGQHSADGGGGPTMKLSWGSDMFNMDKSIDLSSVVKVQRGSECAVASKLPVLLHSRAFSLSTAEGKTLHLVAPTQATREVWLSFVLLIMERRRQPLVELNGVVGEVKMNEEAKTSGDGASSGGVGERVRKSMGGRLSVGRLSLGRLSLGGKNNN